MPYNNIRNILTINTGLESSLRNLNIRYIRSLQLTSGFCFINMVGSGCIIYTNYLDISTITSFVSFTLLLLMKLNTSYTVGKQSYHSSLALSAYLTEPLSFNILDADEHGEDTYDPETGVSYEYSSLYP